MQTFTETPAATPVETIADGAPVAVRCCINCVRALPHVGTSWKESGACRRNEAGITALTDSTLVAEMTETGAGR